ncbi:hypothetical protein, partial [Xanthomonas phaseoli]
IKLTSTPRHQSAGTKKAPASTAWALVRLGFRASTPGCEIDRSKESLHYGKQECQVLQLRKKKPRWGGIFCRRSGNTACCGHRGGETASRHRGY